MSRSRRIRPIVPILLIGLLLASPASAQQDTGQLRTAIDSIAAAERAAQGIPGLSVGVVLGGETVLMEGYGHADLENEVPATEHTVYRLGSLTKQFTAAGIMRLVEQGRVILDTLITAYLPDFPLQGHRVTVRHLLTHTSGIKSYTGLGPEWKEVMKEDLTTAELIDLFEDEPFDFEPGTDYRYNNSGYFLLGVIIENVAGMRYADYIRTEFFEPLEMEDSYYGDHAPIIPRRARGYARNQGRTVNAAYLSMTQPYAAGSLLSTVEDLARWTRALVGLEAVSFASQAAMTTPYRLAGGASTGYGFGLALGELEGHRKIAHGGGINGFSTCMSWYPQEQMNIIVLTNAEWSSPARIEERIARTVLGLPIPEVKDIALTRAPRIER